MRNENKGLGAAATASKAEDVEAGAPTRLSYALWNLSTTLCGATPAPFERLATLGAT